MTRTSRPDPAVLPGALDEVLSDLAAEGIAPTRHAIISAALARRHPADFAAALADAAERPREEDER